MGIFVVEIFFNFRIKTEKQVRQRDAYWETRGCSLQYIYVRGGRSNYFDGLGSIDYFYESNRYFLPVTLDPITCQFHCDMGW